MTLITIGSSTDLGKRETNEDSLLAVVSQDSAPRVGAAEATGSSALLILADGMGGRASGQIASQTAVRVVYRELAHILALRPDSKPEYLEKALQNSLRQANTRIQNLGNGHPNDDGMGTTCTVAVVVRDVVSLAHVGDTRAYLLTDGSPLKALTEDHSVVNDEIRAGRLTEAQARRSKFRNVITRAIGVEPHVTADTVSYELPTGAISRLVISSDGLHGTLHEDQIEDILKHYPDPHDAAVELVAAAKDRGASDNISAIVARIATSAAESDADPTVEPAPNQRNGSANASRSSLPYWNLISFAVGAILTAIIACLILPSAGTYSQFNANLAGRPASSGAPAFNITTAIYAAPQPLLGRSVSPNVLLRAGDDLIVVDPAAHRVLRVSSGGAQVVTSVPDTADLAATPSRAAYWTVDGQGNLYESQASPPLLRKFGPDGRFLRTIAQGVLTAPSAIAVAANGDLFVIDKGVLKKLRASAPSGSEAETGGAPASSAKP
jgi:PPM family protein phosphatase